MTKNPYADPGEKPECNQSVLMFFHLGIVFFYAARADAMAYYYVEVMDQKSFQVNPVALVVFYLFAPGTHGPEDIGYVFTRVFVCILEFL